MDITATSLGVNKTASSTQGISTVLHPVFDLATAKGGVMGERLQRRER
jgi:hypothetical protein